jgi:hypothetical protein
MSKCETCGMPDTQTVLVKCQWYGRGTKWLCVDCLRQGLPSQRAAGRVKGDSGATEVLRRERTK